MDFRRVGLYGVSGCGKTTLLRDFIKTRDDYYWIEGSRAVLLPLNNDLDKFKKLSTEDKYIYREKAIDYAEEILEIEKKNIIIDGHYCFMKDKISYENVMTDKDRKFYTDFIYMDLRPELVLERQRKDKLKKRNYSLEQIKEWISFERSELKKECERCRIRFFTITGDDNISNIDMIKRIL